MSNPKSEPKRCKKRPYSDPLLAGRMMAAVCFIGKNDKPGKLHVYWCEEHGAYHWGHDKYGGKQVQF